MWAVKRYLRRLALVLFLCGAVLLAASFTWSAGVGAEDGPRDFTRPQPTVSFRPPDVPTKVAGGGNLGGGGGGGGGGQQQPPPPPPPPPPPLPTGGGGGGGGGGVAPGTMPTALPATGTGYAIQQRGLQTAAQAALILGLLSLGGSLLPARRAGR